MQKTVLVLILATLAAPAAAQPRTGACATLNAKAAPQFRYLLCSEGLYDRKMQGFLIEFTDGKVLYPIARFADQGFKMGMTTIPNAYADLISPQPPDGNKVLAWANEDGLLFLSQRQQHSEKLYVNTYIVAKNVLDQAGLVIGASPPRGNKCREEIKIIYSPTESTPCILSYIKTNVPGSYADIYCEVLPCKIESGRIRAFVIAFLDDPKKIVQPEPKKTETHTFFKGDCTALKIADREFRCKGVTHFHTRETGRAQFTIVVDDPDDEGHIVSFSGGSDRMPQPDLYELQVDRMLINSGSRPKNAKGLPIPKIEAAAGLCTLIGKIQEDRISRISCKAMDRNGRSYILEFVSDGSPIKKF